ncbi:cupin domain-containing protein [Myxosarcina sp. GI1(2024)]
MTTSSHQPLNDAEPIAIRPDTEVMTRQKLSYFVGISGQTAGTKGLSMHLVVISPGATAAPHFHQGFETGIYVLEGQVETRYGKALEKSCISQTGDFLFIPPGVPHTAINLSQTQPARAIVARNDPNEQENVVPYSIQSDRDKNHTEFNI